MQNLNPDQTRVAPALSNVSFFRAPEAENSIAGLMRNLPESHEPYTDKYFLRTEAILKAEGLNPWVKAQVMVRKGPGEIGGIDEAIAMLSKYTPLKEHGGRIYAKEDGDSFEPCESIMIIEGPIQDIVALETIYLGAISARTTELNDGKTAIDLDEVKTNMAKVVEAAEGRPVIYMGARHWHWNQDAAISFAAYEGGAKSCSTDVGAGTYGDSGVGTIPHVLENIMAWSKGRERAVVESTLAFDRHISPEVPRIALIDYNNREIDDSLLTARELGDRLHAVRVDTCGENIAQGALLSPFSTEAVKFKEREITLPALDEPDAKYWYGTGVTVTGVMALRMALDEAGFKDVKIVLSSGFGDVEKVKAFVRAEKASGIKLFDSLGVGGVYKSRAASMDVVEVGSSPDKLEPCSKTGRGFRPNSELKERLLLEREGSNAA